MMLFPFLLFFLACTPREEQFVEHIISGEASVVEQAVQDLYNVQPPKPGVEIIKKSF